jgi:predicted glycosyltransferase
VRILHYCQHVLGIGHVQRSIQICRACARTHEVVMVMGGPPLTINEPSISLLQLPGLRMDEQFSGLVPCDPEADGDAIKTRRTELLQDLVDTFNPDCLVVELYPFGRKAFRFELDPLLSTCKSKPRSCTIVCSVRDILVEKVQGKEKFEQRAVDTVNRFFDAILIHADQRFVQFEETFGKTAQLRVPRHYTGFITPLPSKATARTIRAQRIRNDDEKLIVAAIGSGSVGGELLDAVVAAWGLLPEPTRCHIQLFTGPYLSDAEFAALCDAQTDHIRVERFTDQYVDWLAAADLCISMAGYNSCMNVLAAGVPALLYPLAQNREQRMRVEKLAAYGTIKMIEENDLKPRVLAESIASMSHAIPAAVDIDLNGAEQTAALIERITLSQSTNR